MARSVQAEPPWDREAEEAVIGSLLIDPDALERVRAAHLHYTDFYRQDLGAIYQAISSLAEKDQDVDYVLVVGELRQQGRLERVGGAASLTKLISRCSSSVHAASYARTIVTRALQRRLLKGTGDLAKLAYGHKGTSGELCREAEERWQALNLHSRADKPRIIETMTADMIMAIDWPEPHWIIPEYLPAGLTILAGRPKVGKSWLSLQIAASVGSGGVVLGKQVPQGKSLMLTLEDPARRLKQRMQMQNWPPYVDAEFLTIDRFLDQLGDLKLDEVARLAHKIESEGYTFCVIDTFSRAFRGDQGKVNEMTDALAPLSEVANRLNICVMLIDHLRKSRGDVYDAVEDILGSTAKAAVPDTLWGLYRLPGKRGTILSITGRDVVPCKLQLSFDTVTGCWQSDGEVGEPKLSDARQEILDVLMDLGPSTNKEIADVLGKNKGNTYRQLQDMLHAGLVTYDDKKYALA